MKTKRVDGEGVETAPAATLRVHRDGGRAAVGGCHCRPTASTERRTEPWIEEIAAVRIHRGRGSASAPITMAMPGYRDHGMQYACLGVDAGNTTGANRICELLGFVAEKRHVTYTKANDPQR